MESPDPNPSTPRPTPPESTDAPIAFDPAREPILAADPDATVDYRPSASGIHRALPAASTGAVVLDPDAYFQELLDGGLMDQAEVTSFRKRIEAREGPRDAEALARELVRAGRLTSYQAGAVLQGKARGLVIGNYVILDKLGAGGMGKVFVARHRRLKRVVALKLLPPSLARDPSAVLRFQREAKAAAKLSHPNIVAVLDADEFRGLHFLVMEYVEGQDLARFVEKRGPLPISKAIDCITQAARGLKAAFDANVVHRDIKPSNLILTADGTLKILDMGLARFDDATGLFGAAKPDAGLTQSNVLLGTVDYMSPEQAFNPRIADHRSDIYSLGCTLHFLLTGRPPFSGETLVERLIAHREQPIPTLTDTRPDVPYAINGLLRRLLAKAPENRFSSLDELIATLESCRVAIGRPSVAGHPPVISEDVPPSEWQPDPASGDDAAPISSAPTTDHRARRVALLVSVALMTLGLVVSGIYFSRSGTGSQSRKRPKVTLTPASAVPKRETIKPAASPSPPDVRREKVEEAIVKARPEIAPRIEPVGLVREFAGHQRRVNSVAVSVDGLRALSGGQDRTVRMWDLATGKESWRVEHDSPVVAVAMSSDGQRGLSGAFDSSVQLWDLRPDHDLGTRHLQGHTGPVFAVTFAFDGRFALTGSADRTVRIWEVTTGREDGPPLVHGSPVVSVATSTVESALTGCQDGTVWLWDLKSRQMVRRLRAPGPVLCVALSPAGNRALSGHPDGLLILWDLDHGAEAGRLVGEGDLVRSVAFLPDGRRALAGTQAGILTLWDVKACRELYRFPGPASGSDHSGHLGMAVLSDGDHALTADSDATVRLWKLPALDKTNEADADRASLR